MIEFSHNVILYYLVCNNILRVVFYILHRENEIHEIFMYFLFTEPSIIEVFLYF